MAPIQKLIKPLTSNGIAVTNLSLATKSSWKNEAGTYDSRTEWHRIVLWGKLGEAAAKLAKGAYVEIEGELRHRSYQKEVRIDEKAVAATSRSPKFKLAFCASWTAPRLPRNPK